MRRGILILLSLGAILWAMGSGNAGQPCSRIWSQPARIRPLAGISRTSQHLTLAGAKNEHLFFMVPLSGDASSLTARFEGLPEGLECHFFRLAAAPPDAAEKFPPDALLPLEEELSLPVSSPATIWISIKIHPHCASGRYPLHLVITGKIDSLRLPVELKVYRFSLPEDLPITIFGGFWHQGGWYPHASAEPPSARIPIIKEYYQSLRSHKFNALGGSYPLSLGRIQVGQRIEDFSTYHELLHYVLDDLQFKYFQIPKLKGWQSVGQPHSSFSRQARIFYPLYSDYLRRHGWENRAINYLVDEPRPPQYGAVLAAFALAKSLAPGIRTMSAGWRPSPEFVRVIDIWAYQAAHFRENEKEQAQLRGQEAWLYANRLQGIDHPLTHPRLIGWLLYRYHFSGYLLWGVNYWPANPWTTPPGPQDFFRRGTLYYPHPRTGLPVPTTRLESLTRGFQDYQYLLLLDQACQAGLIPHQEQAAILAKVDSITANLPGNSFPVSMDELEALRLRIGELLNGINGKLTTPKSRMPSSRLLTNPHHF
jgi:hypothetical protein